MRDYCDSVQWAKQIVADRLRINYRNGSIEVVRLPVEDAYLAHR